MNINDVKNEMIDFFKPGSLIENDFKTNLMMYDRKIKSSQILLVFLSNGQFHYQITDKPKEEILDWPRFIQDGIYIGAFRQCAVISFSTGEIWKFPDEQEIRYKRI